MCAASFGWCHLVNAYGVKSGWSCGWQVKLCDPVNTCHSVALRDCLGRKNALYKYLILYFAFNFTLQSRMLLRQSRTSLRYCCRFDNNVERVFVRFRFFSTKSKQIEHVQFLSILSKGRDFVRRCCPKRQCRSKVRQYWFDIVDGVDVALWQEIGSQTMHYNSIISISYLTEYKALRTTSLKQSLHRVMRCDAT